MDRMTFVVLAEASTFPLPRMCNVGRRRHLSQMGNLVRQCMELKFAKPVY